MELRYTDEQWHAAMEACDWQTGEFFHSFEMQECFEALLSLYEIREEQYHIQTTRGRPPRPIKHTALWASAVQFWRDDLKRSTGQTHDEGNQLYRFVRALSAPLPNCGGLTPEGFRQFQRTIWKRSFSKPFDLKP